MQHVFVLEVDGSIGIRPLSADDRLAETTEIIDLYQECRQKASELRRLGMNMLGDNLGQRLSLLVDRMPKDASLASERQLWSTGNTLRSVLAAHDAVKHYDELHPAKLDPGVAESLRDVVDTFNQLAVVDPKLRMRDAHRLGPQENEKAIAEIRAASKIALDAARDLYHHDVRGRL